MRKKIAIDKDLKLDYINENYITAEFPAKYSLITMIYNDFCVLSPTNREILLSKIHKSLLPNGVFLFDVFSEHFYYNLKEKQSFSHSQNSGFWSPNEHFVFENIYKYENKKVFLEKNTVIEMEKQFTICNYIQCFSLENITNELKENGFIISEYFSNVKGSNYKNESDSIGIIAKKSN